MITTFVLMGLFQTPGAGPTVSTVAIALSGVVMLALIKVTVENRDEVRTNRQLLFGVKGEKDPTGLVHQVTRIAETLTQVQQDIRDQRASIRDEVVNAATVVTSRSQAQVEDKIDKLAKQVALLAERRAEPRP